MLNDVKCGDLVKLLWWDGDGLCPFAKRLERGRFVWPRAEEGLVVLSRAQLSVLLEGIDWRMPRRTWRPELAWSGDRLRQIDSTIGLDDQKGGGDLLHCGRADRARQSAR
jgi:transposase